MLEIKASVLQVVIFVVGLTLSLVVGVMLAAHLDGAAWLLFATLVAGSGLLAAAVFSQVVHDHIVTDEPDAPLPTAPAPLKKPSKR
jgi:hypothetical protein